MRTGQFTRGSHNWGASLSVVKPKNNDPGDLTPPESLNPQLELLVKQLQQGDDDVIDLLGMLGGD